MSKIMTGNQFNKKYRYFAQVPNVTVEFDITDSEQIMNENPHYDDLSRNLMFDKSQSIWFLIDKKSKTILVETTEPSDITNYIKDELEIEIKD